MNQFELREAKAGIGTRLRETRKKRELTQQELGDLAGTNQAVIQKIENGKSKNPRMVEDIALVLEVNPAWLQWGTPYAAMWIEKEKPEPVESIPKPKPKPTPKPEKKRPSRSSNDRWWCG